MKFSGNAERDCKEPLKNNPYMGVSWMEVLLWMDRNDGRKQSDLLGKATYAFLTRKLYGGGMTSVVPPL